MTINELKNLLALGKFHHATYRDFDTVWEGLYIYRQYDGLRGFEVAGCFGKNSSDLAAAEQLVANTGISIGAYGQG